MSSVPVIKFMFRDDWKVLSDALTINPIYESESFSSANELMSFLGNASAGMVVTSLRDKNDLIQIATLIKLTKKLAPNTMVKVIVVNFSGEKQYEKAMAKLGILDLIEPRIQMKALRFKIDFMMKSINVHIKKMENTVSNNAVKSLEATKIQDKKGADLKPIWTEGVDTENDIWLMRSEHDCKRVLTRWLVKMIGPSPYVAQWVESNSSGIWKFDFKAEKESFITGDGYWYFRGDQKPDFIWADNCWSFTGSDFELFYKAGNDIHSRISLKDKQLTIAKNSEYAKTKEQIIIDSFDKDLVFKKEQAAQGETENIDKDQENYKNLEGKGKTDTLNHGPLSGKGKTSHLDSNPLGLDLDQNENNLSSDPLSYSDSQNKKSSHMKGKGGSPAADAGKDLDMDADQGVRTGEELSMDSKKNHEKFYKNHNESEQFAPKDIGHSIKKEGVSDNLKGKTSTDQLEGHLSSPDAPGSKVAKPTKDMSGKSSTDQLDGHMSSPDGQASKAAKAAKDLGGHLSSPVNAKKKDEKSAAEDLDDLLASAETAPSSRAAKPTKDMSGKSSTDKIDGNLSSPSKDKKKSQFISNDDFESSDDEKTEDAKQDSVGSKNANKVVDINSATRDSSRAAVARKNNQVSREFIPREEEIDPSFEDSTQTAKVVSVLIQDDVKLNCKLDDYFDQTIIFSAKKSGMVTDKEVTLNLNFNYMNKDTNLKFKGSVTQIDADDEGSQYITVEISKENASAFNSFMKLYGTRQENINLFLKTVKGY